MPISPAKIMITRRAPAGGIKHVTGAGEKKYGGGQFIPAALQKQEADAAKSQLPFLVDSVALSLQFQVDVYRMSNEILQMPNNIAASLKLFVPLSSTERQMKKTIREAYEQSFTLGKRAGGNLFAVTADERKAIRKTRYDEFDYLTKFLSDIRNGSGVMPYAKRADYYAKAVRELFWLGFVSANRTAKRTIKWVLGDTEHCDTCEGASNAGIMSAEKFWKDYASKGILPQSGKLDCLGYNCKCSLE